MWLILLEHIEGMSMLDMEPKMFLQHIQEQMLKSLIDFESLLFSRNIQLKDMSPRNTIIAQDPGVNPFTSPDPFSGLDTKRIVFVDFAGTGFICARKYMSPERKKCLGKYYSHLLRYNQPSEFMGWFLWYEDDWLEAEYAHTVVSITPEIREAFDGCRR